MECDHPFPFIPIYQLCKTPGWFAAYFHLLGYSLPLGILWYMLSSSGETVRAKEMGMGRRKDQIISCKYSKKIDEVNTKENKLDIFM